jgi:WXG100 family type VII secretion target
MATTQAEAAVMAQVAGKFESAQQSLQATLSALMREVEAVRPEWVGRGGASFDQVTRAWGDDQGRLLRALGDTAGAIRTAGRGYTSTDESASGRMTGVTLPL